MQIPLSHLRLFFFHHPAPTDIYTLSLHDALPIFIPYLVSALGREMLEDLRPYGPRGLAIVPEADAALLEGIDLQDREMYDGLHAVERALAAHQRDRKSTRLNSSHRCISYAVFCLK